MSTSTRLGVGVLNLPTLRGISLDNYEFKLEKRCIERCAKVNRMESNKLDLVLKLTEKSENMFRSNQKTDEERLNRKLMNFRMHWHNTHSMEHLATATDLSREKTRKSSATKYSKKKPDKPLVTEREEFQHVSRPHSRLDTPDDQIVSFFGPKYQKSFHGNNVIEIRRNIPLTFKQKIFLAKLQGLLEPKETQPMPRIRIDDPNSTKRSRLWVNLPLPMDGGDIGKEVRRSSYRYNEDAPIIDIEPDKLVKSKKPDVLATWIGMDEDEVERSELENRGQLLFPDIRVSETEG